MKKDRIVERVDRLVIVENAVRELEEGLELKQTRIDSENIYNRQVERSRG